MQYFLEPRSVVLLGVSRRSGTGAYNNLEMMLRYGYKGRIYVVHPKAEEICEHKAYDSVQELPEVPELAVVSVGRERVLPAVEDCIRKGIKGVVIISQGFSDADERGRELQGQLARTAVENGVRVLGPNTMGVLNAFSGFSTAFVDIPRESFPPPVSLIAQSGVLQVGYESFTTSLGKALDIGNACDVDFVDALQYFEKDPQTEIVAIHMEGMKRGREFLRVAARVARSKPVVVFKTGRSAAGAQAALSHTGSLVGEDAVLETALAEAGVVRARNMDELRAACKAFIHYRRMPGPRLGVVTATGACGIMSADACEDYGLELAPFPENMREQLESPHIAWHRLRNPVDIWPLGMVSGSFVEVLKKAVKGLLRDDRVDAVLSIAPVMASPLHEDLKLRDAVREIQAANEGRKPVAFWLYGDMAAQHGELLDAQEGVACFESIDQAVMGLGAFWRHEKQRRRKGPEDRFDLPSPSSPPPVRLPANEAVIGQSAYELVEHYGIPLVPGGIAADASEAAAIAREAGYPVVAKIVSPQWTHKSDRGGVLTDVASEKELMEAFGNLQKFFLQQTPDGHLNGILVQKQIEGFELLFGIKKDPQLGPVLVAGMGGIYTEILKDVAYSLVPVGRSDAERMLRSLRVHPILKGMRGREGAHWPALMDIMIALSEMGCDCPEIKELDLNPVIANAEGAWCVDCRIVTE